MSPARHKVASGDSEIHKQLKATYHDEPAAVELVERERWGDNPHCPHCGSVAVYKMLDKAGNRNRRYLWRCKDCNAQYSVRYGTVMEDSRIPVRVWCFAFHAVCKSKKGISALQVSREMGLSYKSALFLMHRVRFAMRDGGTRPPRKLRGVVEADETYIGGRPRHEKGRVTARPKMPVVALVERGGEVRAMPMRRVTAKNLTAALVQHVDPDARVMTDDANLYKRLDEYFAGHASVNHRRKEYARREGDLLVSSNTVESFFSLLKRGVYGTFHSVSEKHLARYVDEFVFRHNLRHLDDGERTMRAIRAAEGKRLIYKAVRLG